MSRCLLNLLRHPLHISSTRWRSVSDQKNKIYYFESVMTPNLFWLDLKKIDFSPKAGIKKLPLTNGKRKFSMSRLTWKEICRSNIFKR